MRWPRKNDPASIRTRQEILGVAGLVTSVELEPFAGAAEALTGVAIIPVSACPITIELGDYELDEAGAVVERSPGRGDGPRPARPHRGQPHALDDPRLDRRGDRVDLRPRRPDHPRLVLRLRRRGAPRSRSPRWIEAELPAMRRLARATPTTRRSPVTPACASVRTHVVGPMCHALWAWTTGDAVGPNMMTRNAYALNMGYVHGSGPRRSPSAPTSRRTWAATRSRRTSTSPPATARR